MSKKKNAGLLLGFTLLVLGFTSLILELIGIHWFFLGWIEKGGRLFAFLFKIMMVIVGIIIFVVSRTDWEREIKECEPDPKQN